MSAKRILISGTSRGVGRALALRWLDAGCRVAGCSRSAGSIEHANYLHVQADVARESDVVRLVHEAVGFFGGGLDATICNAGTASMNHLLLTPDATIGQLLDVNVRGTMLLCRESAKAMKPARTGRLVTFSSVAVPLRLAGEAVYAAAKSAVETYTRVAARELAPMGITVNCVAPAPIRTDLTKTVPQEKMDDLLRRLAIQAYGSFDDVANAVEFFLREESAAVTGQVLYLGGAG